RNYRVSHPALLDFGSPSPKPFTVTCWVKTTISASQLTTLNNPPNMYVYTFDNPNPAYPGHALDLARQFAEPDNGHIVTEFAVDSDAAQVSDFGNSIVNDGNWHLIAGVYPCPAGADQHTQINGSIYVDGVLDVTSNGSLQDLPFYGIGQPGATQPLYIGT